MSYSSLALTSTVTLAERTIWELRAPGSSAPAIVEMVIINASSVGCVYLFGKPTVPATGPTPVPFQMHNPADRQTNVTAAVSYSSTGAAPVFAVRRAESGGLVGSTVIWAFPMGLIIPRGTSICLWGTGVQTAQHVNCTIKE